MMPCKPRRPARKCILTVYKSASSLTLHVPISPFQPTKAPGALFRSSRRLPVPPEVSATEKRLPVISQHDEEAQTARSCQCVFYCEWHHTAGRV